MKKKLSGQAKNIDENIKEMFERMELAQELGMSKKTRWLEQISSLTFLLSPPILLVLSIRQFIITSWDMPLRLTFLIIAIFILIGYGYYVYKESMLWRVFRS